MKGTNVPDVPVVPLNGMDVIAASTKISGSPSWDEMFGGGRNPFSKSAIELHQCNANKFAKRLQMSDAHKHATRNHKDVVGIVGGDYRPVVDAPDLSDPSAEQSKANASLGAIAGGAASIVSPDLGEAVQKGVSGFLNDEKPAPVAEQIHEHTSDSVIAWASGNVRSFTPLGDSPATPPVLGVAPSRQTPAAEPNTFGAGGPLTPGRDCSSGHLNTQDILNGNFKRFGG